jgi:hypothetical protein
MMQQHNVIVLLHLAVRPQLSHSGRNLTPRSRCHGRGNSRAALQ